MYSLTKGNETKAIISFSIPMIVGNIFQQLYNVADTIIVGKFINSNALAAVGSSFAVMVLLTSIILGLCMGSGAVFSFFYGSQEEDNLKNSFYTSFWFIGLVTLIINILALLFIDNILHFIKIPQEIYSDTRAYLKIIFYGLSFTSIFNYFSAIMRSMGNSIVPLKFLILSAIVNIVLDIIFVLPLKMGVQGAAYATIIAQALSAFSLAIFCIKNTDQLRLAKKHLKFKGKIINMILSYSILSSVQQTIMNFGILMIQGLVNSFGVATIAAFTAVVKIDSFAYMPVQDFGNAFSTFIAQNKGAKENQRIKNGIKSGLLINTIYCIIVSTLVIIFSRPLLLAFLDANELEIIELGVNYLRIISPFYILIGYLFMFYGFYRGLGKSLVSIILTIVSLGTRIILAYTMAPIFGVKGIWWSIPIGWFLSDLLGLILIKFNVES